MTPHGFVAKWRASPKDGQRHSQSHFNDLCALLGVPDPATAGDPGFGFEKGPPRRPAAAAGSTSGSAAAFAGSTRATAAASATPIASA